MNRSLPELLAAHAVDVAADTAGEDRQALEQLAAIVTRNMPAWYADAACREHDPELWFPVRGQSTATAKDVCARCLVRAECLETALDLPRTTQGIWAGTSGRQRVALARERRTLHDIAARRDAAHGPRRPPTFPFPPPSSTGTSDVA